jgi:hypothetical protein
MLQRSHTASARPRQPRRRPTTGLTIAQRAVLAAHWADKGIPLHRCCDVVCVCQTYVNAVRRLSEADRLRLVRGEFSLSKLVNGRGQRRESTDADVDRVVAKLDRLVARFGADRVLQELDRAIRPHAVAAE